MPRAIRILLICAVAGGCLAAISGCAETRSEAAPGSAGNPVRGSHEPIEEDEGHATRPSICALVTRAEAQPILGTALLDPVEAPLGPTCIYTATSRDVVATLAVQTTPFKPMVRLLRKARRVRAGRRVAWCGTLGTPTLLLSLPRGRVLTIVAPCSRGKRLAAVALPRLRRYS